MIDRDSKQHFRDLQDRLRNPLLTALAVLLVLIIFVIAPLHAAGIVKSQGYRIAAALVLVAAVLVMSGSTLAVTAMLIAVGLAIGATLLPHSQDSNLDIHLYATAWVTLGLPLL
jgi:hypothetical protein